MPLTEQQRNFIKNRFSEMYAKRECPICGQNNWEPDGFAAIQMLTENREQLDPSAIIPTVIIACNFCGYIMQLSAIKLGLV